MTPNMHMHLHLKDVIMDYGPVYAFWLFAYERYNGILEHQPNNNRSIEIQLMNRFIRDNNAYSIQPPSMYRDELDDLCTLPLSLSGSLTETCIDDNISGRPAQLVFPTSCTRHVFGEGELVILKEVLKKLKIMSEECTCNLNSTYYKYKQITKNDQIFLSSTYKYMSVAMAKWDEDIYGSSPTTFPRLFANPIDATLRPVRINFFLKLSYLVSDVVYTHYFVYVSWFQPHPCRFSIGKPAQLWCKSAFEAEGIYSFLPLHSISCRCIHTLMQINGDTCLAVVPLVN